MMNNPTEMSQNMPERNRQRNQLHQQMNQNEIIRH